eukprot:g4381.t1
MAFAPVVTFKENTAGRAASTAEPSPISTEAQMDRRCGAGHGAGGDLGGIVLVERSNTKRSTSSNPSLPLSPESRPQLDMEVVESTNSAAFMLLTVPRERSSPQGLRGPSPSCYGPLPTVLGRRDCSKSSSKSIAACYQLNPSSPQSGSLGLPRSPNTSSWLPARFRREECSCCSIQACAIRAHTIQASFPSGLSSQADWSGD